MDRAAFPASYVEIQANGYVEASHAYAGVLFEGARYIDAGVALLIADAAIAVAARLHVGQALADRVQVGLYVRRSDTAWPFGWEPGAGPTGSTQHPNLAIEVVAEANSLSERMSLLKDLERRLANAYGLDSTAALTDGGLYNRLWHPITGEW